MPDQKTQEDMDTDWGPTSTEPALPSQADDTKSEGTEPHNTPMDIERGEDTTAQMEVDMDTGRATAMNSNHAVTSTKAASPSPQKENPENSKMELDHTSEHNKRGRDAT